MRRVVIVLLIAVVPLQVLAAAPKKPLAATRQAMKPMPRKPNPCAIYGAGFMQVEGTSTCIKIGGSIGIGGGASR